MTQDETPNGVDPDALKAYLATQGLQPKDDDQLRPPMAETVVKLEDTAGGELSENGPEFPVPAHALELNEDNLASYVMARERMDPITVSAGDRDAYLRAFWHDERFEIPIALPGPRKPVRFIVRSLMRCEEDLLQMAVLADRREGLVDSIDALRSLERFQHYACCIMVTHAFDAPVDVFSYDHDITAKENMGKLRDIRTKVFSRMSALTVSRWCTAIIRFECIQNICLNKSGSPDFWETQE